jgi:hypothetical protein
MQHRRDARQEHISERVAWRGLQFGSGKYRVLLEVARNSTTTSVRVLEPLIVSASSEFAPRKYLFRSM